jgi:hypothetical protein
VATIDSNNPSSGLPESTVKNAISNKMATMGWRTPDTMTMTRSMNPVGP